MTIEDNVAARKYAADAIDMITCFGSECDLTPAQSRLYFERVRDAVASILGDDKPSPERPIDKMTDAEARAWDSRATMPFGKHEGTKICNVPLEYLLWLDDQPNWRDALRRYLASDYSQRHQAAEERG